MAKYAVSAHSVLWHVGKDKGSIRIKFHGARRTCTLKPSSASEFFALIMMLQGSKLVVYDDQTKVISTSW